MLSVTWPGGLDMRDAMNYYLLCIDMMRQKALFKKSIISVLRDKSTAVGFKH